jgi:hypothetical protein
MRLLFALILVILALLLVGIVLLLRPSWAAPHCLAYEERTMNRLQTVCDDGTRAVHTHNQTLSRWESTVTPTPTFTPLQRAPRGKEHRR